MNGNELREIRHRLRLTQAQFAERLGISPNSVARQEQNVIGISEPVARLARLLLELTEIKVRNQRKGDSMDTASYVVKVNTLARDCILHKAWCREIAKRGGAPGAYGQVIYENFPTRTEAENYQDEWRAKGYPKVKQCAKCWRIQNPRTNWRRRNAKK